MAPTLPKFRWFTEKNGVAKNHQLESIYQPTMVFVKLFLQKLHHQQIWKKNTQDNERLEV